MPDNQNLPDKYNRDDDVPFKLPKEEDLHPVERPSKDQNVITGDFEVIEPRQAISPPPPPISLPKSKHPTDEGDTDELVFVDGKPVLDDERYDDEHDVPFKLPQHETDPSPKGDGRFINKMMTMPTPAQSGDPSKQTLAGSGGFDPNPDFANVRPPAPTINNPRVPAAQPPPMQSQSNQDDRYRRPQTAHYAPPPTQPSSSPILPPQGGRIAQPPIPTKSQRKRAGRPRFNLGCLAIFIGLFVTFCGGMTLISGVVFLVGYARVGELVNERLAQFDEYRNFQSTFLYDRNGQLLYEVFNEGRRTQISLADVPQDLINATIAIEDDEFWTNVGIDVPATTVAFLGFVGIRDTAAGGSTITQQLVRNVLFPPEYRSERSATRKAEEIILAVALTSRESKEKILEYYLNEIYYGNLAYGIEAASQTFFGKSAKDLTLGESALLAGLPQAPANLNPLNPDPDVQDAVEDRWRIVLNEMVEEGYITDAQRNQALSQGLSFANSQINLRAPHFTVYAQSQLELLLTDLGYSPSDIANGGLRVYTTVDLRINDMVQLSVRDQISRLQANNVGNGAVVVIKPFTGEILAMIGSADYDNEAIDGRVNVTTARRQPGSTVKAFTYAAAMERGTNPADVLWDTRTQIGIPGQQPYIPRNYDGGFHGPMGMRIALANSYNIPAVQALRHSVGVDYWLSFANRLGITSLVNDPSLYGLSLTLGGGEVTNVELTNAYAVFANGGQYTPPVSILCVIDNNDNIIYQYENSCPQGNITAETQNRGRQGLQVLDPRIAFIISDILSDNVARSPVMGSNSPLRTQGFTAAVKTGTTDNVKDNWTVGYTRNVAVGVWVGNSDGAPMVNSSGLTGAAPIWNTVITQIHQNPDFLAEFAHNGQLFPDRFEQPAGVSLREVCNFRAMQDPTPNCPLIREWALDGPAGLPSGDGGLYYPQQAPINAPPDTGDYVSLAYPGVYRAVVIPLAPEVSASLQIQVGPGDIAPPSPKYCRVRVDQVSNAVGAQEFLFIAPPPNPNDAAQAEQYARSTNLPFLPTIQCSPEMLAGGGGGGYGPIVATAIVTSPQPGEAIPVGGMPILGTVVWAPGQAMYYKVEIIGGQFTDWTTIGDIHYNTVENGQIEFLPGAPGLQPGNYQLRLVIIGNDASALQQPYVVSFVVQ